MSADLWAAFGDAQPAENPWATQDRKEKLGNDDLAASTNSLTSNVNNVSSTITAAPLASTSTLTSPNDAWTSIDALSSVAKPSKTTTVPSKAISALPEDDWSDFESAIPSLPATSIPQTRSQSLQNEAVDDGWSTFEAAPQPANITPEKREESTFNDAGVMWDADEALEPPSHLSSPSRTRKAFAGSATPTPAFIDLSSISNLAISAQQPQTGSYNDLEDDFGDFEQADSSEPMTIPMPVSELASDPASAPPTSVSMPTVEPRTTATVPAAIMQNRIETRGTGADGLIFGATQKASALPQIQMIDPAPQSAPPPGLTRTRTISAADRLKPLPPDPPLITPTPETEKTEDDYFDDWDDIASPSAPPGATAPALQPVSAATGASQPGFEDLITTFPDTTDAEMSNKTKTDPAPSALPPSNIPPPSILLSHLSASVLPKLANPSSQTAPNPVLRTAAHILAGRKHRWKRDTHLAQSMSISAAGGAGVKSGMKLTGVDRAETAREDRDAAELLRVFKAKSGALRAAANRAADGIGDGKGVVELKDGAPIRVEKAVPAKTGNAKGSVTVVAASGGKPCVICGLRRAERVAGVDVDVYDGFGEWWIEHWGHRECKSWWEAEEAALRSK